MDEMDKFHPDNVNSDVGSNANNDDGNDVRMKLGMSFVTISWVHLWNINIITLYIYVVHINLHTIGKGLWLSGQMFILAI